jgi:hypothetical protein
MTTYKSLKNLTIAMGIVTSIGLAASMIIIGIITA